jgi:hypothetical protein
MLVYICSNYSYPDLLRQTPGSKGEWEGIQFTFDEVEKCDVVVVINHPRKDIKIKCRKGGRILFIQEPPYQRNDYLKSYFPFFDKIICAFDKANSANIINDQAALPWHINKNYDELMNLQNTNSEKANKISWITSNSNVNPGHKPRLKFLEILKQTDLNVDVFGRGINAINDKFDGIYPYQYTLAIENYADKNYWTEKIADAFLCYTMPIYYGCENIEDFFPKGSFIKIDIHKPTEAIEIIKNALKNDLWKKNIGAITEARNLVLNKYQFFPFVKELIANLDCKENYISTKIAENPNSRKKKIIEKLKNLFQ